LNGFIVPALVFSREYITDELHLINPEAHRFRKITTNLHNDNILLEIFFKENSSHLKLKTRQTDC